MRTALAETLEKDLEQLTSEISRLDSEVVTKEAAAEQVVSEIRESGTNPLTDEDAFTRVDDAYKAADLPREEASRLRQRRERVMEMLGKSRPAPHRPALGGGGGWANRAIAALHSSPSYQALSKAGAFESEISRIEIPGVEALSRDEALAFLNGGKVGAAVADIGAMVPDDQRLFPPVEFPARPPRVLDLIPKSTTDSDTVIYVEETTRTDAAAETALGTAAAEATYVYTSRTVNVRDITHFTPAHKRNLADQGQARALLENRLGSGVIRRLETQVIGGDGAGENIRGILNTSGIGTVAKGAEPRIETLHKAITLVRLALFAEPDNIILHPTDYEEVVFEKDANGAYLLGPAALQTSRTIWGFPTMPTAAETLGTGLIGNFSEGAMLWLRAGLMLSASDSHSDFFTKRQVALLAELRAAFAAWQPKAFATATGI